MISTMRCFPVISLLASLRLLSLVSCKPVHEDIVRAQSLAACDHLQNALQTDITALSGQQETALSGSYGTVDDDVIFKLEKGHLQLHSASANALKRLGIVNASDREGERREAFNVVERLGEQLVRTGIPEERPAEIGSQVQAVPNDEFNDVNGVDPYSKVAKRIVKTLDNYIQTYAESFENLQKKVVEEIFTKDILEKIENCSAQEELRSQISKAEKIITSANLTGIILNNKTLTPDELENEVASLNYQLVSDRISQAMLDLKRAASFQLNATLENYCGEDRLRHNEDKIDLRFIFAPNARLSQPPVSCRECPCGTIPPEPPTAESTTVTPPPMAACVCPCGTKPPTDPPTETTVRPPTLGQRSLHDHCQCPCGTLPPSPQPPFPPSPNVVQEFTTLSPPPTDVSETSSTPWEDPLSDQDTTTAVSVLTTDEDPGVFGDPRMFVYNRISLFGDPSDDAAEDSLPKAFEPTNDTVSTRVGTAHEDVPDSLRDFSPLKVTGSESPSEVDNSHTNEFPTRPKLSHSGGRKTATSILNLWPSLLSSKPVFFETETGRGQLLFKVWFKERKKPSEESSSEESSRRKCKHKHKSSCSSSSSSSSEESDSKSKCSGKAMHLHRQSPCSDDRPCGKSGSSASDSSQWSFSSSESSEECYSCSGEFSDEHCSSSDDCSCVSCSDSYEDYSTQEDRKR